MTVSRYPYTLSLSSEGNRVTIDAISGKHEAIPEKEEATACKTHRAVLDFLQHLSQSPNLPLIKLDHEKIDHNMSPKDQLQQLICFVREKMLGGSVSDQLETLLSTQKDKPSLIATLQQIQKFILTGKDRKASERAVFNYIDQGTKGKFTEALGSNFRNLVVDIEYSKYQNKLKQFLDDARAAHLQNSPYAIHHHFNEVVKIVAGELGVIQSANCANFAGITSDEPCHIL
jgi:hypothetical protein